MTGSISSADSKAGLRIESQNEGSLRIGVWPALFNPRTLLVFVGYYLGAKLGFALTFQPHPVSVLWPPNALLLAALLLSPARFWALLLLAAFPAHLLAEFQSGVPLKMNLCWFISNSCEAVIGAASTRFLIGHRRCFESLQTAAILFLCGAFLAPFLSSFVDSAFVSLNHWGDQDYWLVWRMRFCSNVFATLILAPVILMWGTARLRSSINVSPQRVIEAGVVFLCLVLVSLAVFCQKTGPTMVPTLLYAPLPFLWWAAVRFGPLATSTSTLSVALLAIWCAVQGRGPFASHSPEQNALSIQVFFGVSSITLLFLATAVAEHRKAEERFIKKFRSSPDAMAFSHLKNHQINEVNEAWEKLLGYQRNEAIGQSWSNLNIYASGPDREKLVAGLSAGNGFHDMELCLRTKTGGLRHTMVSADSDNIGYKHYLIITIRDVTDRKHAEEVRRNLDHVSRLAVVGELTAMIAHQVNQPLGAILCNADAAEMLLEPGKPLPNMSEIRQILSDIRKNDLRAEETIRHLRAFLRKREMQMEPLDLNETLSDVMQLVTGDAFHRGIQVRSELARDLPFVFGDQVHLQQVLLNLIVNGMDAMKDTSESKRQLMVRTERIDKESIEAAVTDSGHGIAPDNLSRIFESFFTTKPDGLGLGLSIARAIIEAHGGQIWVENNETGGATFRFTLQVATTPPNVTETEDS
jgi:two-component system sensor kinase FixL